jgi:hypothetical protein
MIERYFLVKDPDTIYAVHSGAMEREVWASVRAMAVRKKESLAKLKKRMTEDGYRVALMREVGPE